MVEVERASVCASSSCFYVVFGEVEAVRTGGLLARRVFGAVLDEVLGGRGG